MISGGTAAVSWISSGTLLISNALQLSERIGKLLRPTGELCGSDDGLSAEERHALFQLQTYLLGCIEPLSICQTWSERRLSGVDQMTNHAETIILDCLKAVRPLLLGQRPAAAVSYLAGKPLRARDVLTSYRQQFYTKLLMNAERLRLAKDLLGTAMITMQATEYLHNKVHGRQHPLCLASLLSAHRKLVELQHCSGTLSFFKGKMFTTIQSLQPKPEFLPNNGHNSRQDGHSSRQDGNNSRQDVSAAADNDTIDSHVWHRLPGYYHLSILRREGDRHELRVEMRSGRRQTTVAGGRLTCGDGGTGKSCSQWLHETRKTISLDITASKYMSWSFEHDSLEDLLLAARHASTACDCCLSTDKWHEVEETSTDGLLPFNSAAPDSFERVEIDTAPPPKDTHGSRRARKRSRKPSAASKPLPAEPPRPSPSLPVAAVEPKIHAIELPGLLFETGGAGLPVPSVDTGGSAPWDVPVAIFVISSGKKEDVLRFMYLARLIYAHSSARDIGGGLVSHESLLRLLTL